MLWSNQNYVTKLKNVKHHLEKVKLLLNLNYDTLHHTILFGPVGSGKKTIAKLLVQNMVTKKYKIKKFKYEKHIINIKYNNITYEYSFLKNNYVYIIDVAILGKKKHVFIEKFIKTFIKTENIYTKQFNVLLFLNMELLDKKSMEQLNIYMEKYIKTCRFIFVSNKPSFFRRLKHNFISICLGKINDKEIISILKNVYKQEKKQNKQIITLKKHMLEQIIKKNNNKIADCINDIQIVCEFGYEYMDKETYHEIFFKNIHAMLKKKSFRNLKIIRNYLYNYTIREPNISEVLIKLVMYLYKQKYFKMDNFNGYMCKLIENYTKAYNYENKTLFICVELFIMDLLLV